MVKYNCPFCGKELFSDGIILDFHSFCCIDCRISITVNLDDPRTESISAPQGMSALDIILRRNKNEEY